MSNDEYYAAYASITSSDSNFTSTSKGGTINFKASGGEVRIYVSCGTDWLVENSNSKAFTTYITDTDYLIVSAGQNLVEDEVAGTITLTTAGRHIAFASITVLQNAYGAPEITVDTNEWHVPAVGELATEIAVVANCDWIVECGAEWLTVEKSGTGLNLTAAENEDTEDRVAEIVLTCTDGYNSDSETVTVTQDGVAYITISEDALEFDAEGGEAVITVESNFDWEYMYKRDWFSIEEDGEDGSLTITCSSSKVEEEREGVVTFTAGDGASNIIKVELPITQGAYIMPNIIVDTDEWHVPAVGELSTEIAVEATGEWTAESDAGWLTVEKSENALRLTAEENTETAERTAEVTVTCNDEYNSHSEKIKVTQDALAYITLSEEELFLSQLGNEVSVAVESNYDWECVDMPDWLSMEKAGDGESLKITYTTNETGVNRDCSITVTAGDGASNVAEAKVNITQLAYSLSVDTNEWHAPAIGELNKVIAVEAPADWTVETEVDWLTVEKTETGIIITAEENVETTERTGKIVLAFINVVNSSSVTIAVTQDGAAYITLGEEELAFYAYEYSSTVSIKTNYDWDYTCESDWLMVEKSTNGKSLTIICATNEAVSDREATLTVIAGDGIMNVSEAKLRVTQKGYNPENSLILEYSLSSSGQTVKLPLTSVTYALINWGDGELETIFSNYPSHKYATSGTYDVTVNGEVAHIQSYESYSLVSGATSLVAVVQWGDLGLTDMSYAFYECSKLESLPKSLGAFSNVTSFSYCFYYCNKLTSAPSFEGCSVATTFSYAFYSCSSLVTVPENMFSGCSAATSFSYAFDGCSVLAAVPENIFSECTSATNFSYCFRNCYELTSAPSFEGCSTATTFSHAFDGCSDLTTVPGNMFSACVAVTDFSNCFYDCTKLTSAPSFEGCSAVTTFNKTFYCCSVLSTIPENMFSGCTKARDFAYCFYSCKKLTSAPSFSGCPSATKFNYAFYNCSVLTTIPENMFSECTNVMDFSYCFYLCNKLTSAPSFEGCTAATTFSYAFYSCSSLVTVPENMFSGCYAVTDFSYSFYGCSSLAAVPENIFSGCAAVTDFSYMFSRCSSLITVPVGIFDSCLSVLNFQGTFYVCEEVEGESPYTEINEEGETVKVHLYERENYPKYFTAPTGYFRCFSFSTFSDYSRIPTKWTAF